MKLNFKIDQLQNLFVVSVIARPALFNKGHIR